MNWTDFLAKIKILKKDYEAGQVDLKAPALVTLLYSGAFDSMIGKTTIDHTEYRRLADELMQALGSKAALPKAKKGEIIGIDNISSNLDLHMWRSESNPTYKFDFTSLFDSFLTALQFQKTQSPVVSYRQAIEGKTEILVFRNIESIFDGTPLSKYLLKRDSKTAVGIVGIIKDYRIRKTKNGREMGTFRLFTGEGFTPNVYIWPDKSEIFLPFKKTQHLKNGRSGLAIVKPGTWNEKPQFTLVHWAPTNEKVGA